MSTAPEPAVDSDVTTQIELEAVRDQAPLDHAAIPVRARRHAILLADVEISLAGAKRPR